MQVEITPGTMRLESDSAGATVAVIIGETQIGPRTVTIPLHGEALTVGDLRQRLAEACMASEPVHLADGAADQSLIPGVAPVPLAARQIASETARRAQRQGHAPLPCGGLWDETAINQQELFR